jgi:hypothetical protein
MKKILSCSGYRLLLALILLLNKDVYAQCGSERWDIKILNAAEVADIIFTPTSSTVHKQLAFPKPAYHENNPRDATEKKVYRINCKLVKYKVENDSDWHLVVQDLVTNEKMVVEIPSLNCIDQSNTRFNKIDISRRRLRNQVGPVTTQYRLPPAGTRLQITGVGFFDKSNHPVGFKGRELHPVLDLKVLQ